MKLIDADELRKDILDMPNCYNGFSDTYDKAMIVDMIDEQTSVDAIPVEWIQNILAEIGSDSPYRPAIEWLLLTYKMEKED